MTRYVMRGRRVVTRLVTVPEEATVAPVVAEPIEAPAAVSRRTLFFSSTADLVLMAAERGLDATGTRSELIERLS